MDLEAAKEMNSPAWKGVRLAAIFFFVIAGALLVATLLAPSRVGAEAGSTQTTTAHRTIPGNRH